MGTRCHHGMHRHTHELFLRNIRAEGLVLFCLRIHHMKSCVDGIQGCVEIRQFLLPHRLVCYIIVEVVIILQQILMVLIHADITVQRKNKSSDGRNIVYRRDWSCLIQLVQISLPFRCADRNSQLRLIVVTAEQCGTSHTGFFCDLIHADRFDFLFHKKPERRIDDPLVAPLLFIHLFLRFSHFSLPFSYILTVHFMVKGCDCQRL